MRAFFARIRSGWADAGHGIRLGVLGIVIAVAAGLGTQIWLVQTAVRSVHGSERGSVPDSRMTNGSEVSENPATRKEVGTHDAATAVAAGRKFLALQDEWEHRLTAKAADAVERAFSGRAVVTVNLELSRHSEERSGVNVPPGGLQPSVVESGPPRESTKALQSDPNLTPAVNAFRSKMRREDAGDVRRKELDPELYGKKIELQLAPAIQRITASVVLDEAAFKADEDAIATTAVVVDMVKHAIGFDETRGDRIHASAQMKFAKPSTVDAWTTGLAWTMLAMILVLTFLAVWFSQDRHPAPAVADPSQLADRMRRDIEAAIERDPAAVSRVLSEWAREVRL